MLVFWKEKLVLFAVPKTGTTALEAALTPSADIAILNPPGLKHCNVPKYERELARVFEKQDRVLTRVAVIREPMDWLGSWYRYRSRPAIAGTPKAVPGISFSQFVEEWLKEQPKPFARIGTQATFLTNRNGHLGVDHLFRYEELSRAVTFLQDRLNRPITLEQRNVSPRKPLPQDADLRAMVLAQRPREFAIWEAAG